MQSHFDSSVPAQNAGLISLNLWLQQIGRTACTAWRWRRKGWLKVTNICGRLYVSAEAIREFNERAARGEFAQEHPVPSRKEAGL